MESDLLYLFILLILCCNFPSSGREGAASPTDPSIAMDRVCNGSYTLKRTRQDIHFSTIEESPRTRSGEEDIMSTDKRGFKPQKKPNMSVRLLLVLSIFLSLCACVGLLVSFALNLNPSASVSNQQTPTTAHPHENSSMNTLSNIITDHTARLDIGKRFKKTNITQTVPNVSSYIPWMPEKYWRNHSKAHFFIIKHLNVQTWITLIIQNLAPSYEAHQTGNFFSFRNTPYKLNFDHRFRFYGNC